MNSMTQTSLRILLVAVLAVCPNLAATRVAAAEAAGTPGVFAKVGELQGTVLDSNLNPVSGTSMKVLDAEGNVVASAVTDETGAFSLPELEPGQYQLQIGEDVQLALNVSDLGTTSQLRVVLPDDALIGAAAAEGAADGGWSYLAIGTVGLAVIGGGIGIGYAVDSDDDGHD